MKWNTSKKKKGIRNKTTEKKVNEKILDIARQKNGEDLTPQTRSNCLQYFIIQLENNKLLKIFEKTQMITTIRTDVKVKTFIFNKFWNDQGGKKCLSVYVFSVAVWCTREKNMHRVPFKRSKVTWWIEEPNP